MKAWYLNKLLKYLNSHFQHFTSGDSTIWVMKNKVVALWDDGDLEIVWDIFKEGVLKP